MAQCWRPTTFKDTCDGLVVLEKDALHSTIVDKSKIFTSYLFISNIMKVREVLPIFLASMLRSTSPTPRMKKLSCVVGLNEVAWLCTGALS